MSPGGVSLQCTSFGVPFSLVADSRLLLRRMLQSAPFDTQTNDLQPDNEKKSGGPPQFSLRKSLTGGFCLRAGEQLRAEAATPELLFQNLTRELMVHVADHSPERVFIHAGVVGWKGHAILLPGTSFAGKTTLVAALVRAGAVYYSDEYAVLDEHGRVHPYARDLQMRAPGRPEQVSVAVGSLGGRPGVLPLPVAQVLFVHYEETGFWNPQPVTAGMAVLEMMRHAIAVQRTPGRVLAALSAVMQTAVAAQSKRGDATATAELLIRAFDQSVAGKQI